MDEDTNFSGLAFSINWVSRLRLAPLALKFWLPLMLMGLSVGCSDTASNADAMKILDRQRFFQLELTSIRNESFPLSGKRIVRQPYSCFSMATVRFVNDTHPS